MMPYLDAVYKGSLRLYLVVPLIARNLARPIRVGPVDVPAGPTVLCISTTCTVTRTFGTDPMSLTRNGFLSPLRKGIRTPLYHSPQDHATALVRSMLYKRIKSLQRISLEISM